ncbi:transporter substrate-binding domain-containing protein [bacterium]|nr:MAG: transporter substrate-binding domain-containing protein [bacterium]
MKAIRLRIAIISFLTVFTSAFFSDLNAQSYKGVTWETAQQTKSGTVTIVYYPEEAFAYKDRQGRPTGVELDILSQFVSWVRNAKGVDLEVEWVAQSDFEKLYNDVKSSSGGVIGAGNITITDARKKELQFSPAYLNNIAVLYSNSASPDLKTLDQIGTTFKGMSAVVHKGTTHVETLNELKQKYFPSFSIKQVNSDEEAINQVIADPKLFSYTDLSNYWLAQKENKPIKRHPVGDKTTEQFGFILPLNSDWEPLLKEFFNLGSGYRSNVTYKRILMRHLGSEVTKMLEMAQANHK